MLTRSRGYESTPQNRKNIFFIAFSQKSTRFDRILSIFLFHYKVFTDGHTDYVVDHIELQAGNSLSISGFKNVWDNTHHPPIILPNKTFTHILKVEHIL